jgi:hypothetical protein
MSRRKRPLRPNGGAYVVSVVFVAREGLSESRRDRVPTMAQPVREMLMNDKNTFPDDAVKLLFDATKTMIPVITGFLVFFAGTLGTPWIGVNVAREHLVTIGTVALLGLGALGFWTGTMPFCIMASERRNVRLFRLGQYCGRFGHVLFFCSVAAAVWFYFSTVRMP